MKLQSLCCLSILACGLTISSVRAAPKMKMPMSHSAHATSGAKSSAFSKAMQQSMTTMHKNMMAGAMTGNPDRDFATMMIPHHQGAVDMAKIELQYGKDPVLRRLAQQIINSQRQEIATMQAQLKKLSTAKPVAHH